MSIASREVRLVRRPAGEPVAEDFELAETEIASPAPGRLVVRNRWLSVDPYMRGRMNDVKSYVPPFRLGEAMEGGAVGTVVESADESVPVGTSVIHMAGWREYAEVSARAVRPIDPAAAPEQAHLGVLGSTGLTAYIGLTEIAPVKEGDVVFVSGAAGAVGSVAGQIARQLGAAKVIGSTGGPQKAARLTESLGFDAAVDYRLGDIEAQLKSVAPEGVDVYFDNVGGDQLRAAIARANVGGRIALCGAISQYNATTPVPGPDNLSLAITKRLTLRGFIITDYLAAGPAWAERAAGWLADGRLRAEETVVEGIDEAVGAFLGLLRGANTGKMLVKIP
jgi:NADPH-dependent curcumin reductase CurA